MSRLTQMDRYMGSPVEYGGRLVTVAAMHADLESLGVALVARNRMVLQAVTNAERRNLAGQVEHYGLSVHNSFGAAMAELDAEAGETDA